MKWCVDLVQDSFDELRNCPDKEFDVTITDPPFSEHVQKNLCSGSLVGKKSVPKYELPFEALQEYTWARDLVRVTRRWVLICCSLEDFGRFEMTVGRPTYVRSGVWFKPNAMGQLTRDRPATSYEGIAIMHTPTLKKRWNGVGSYGIWKCNGTRGLKERHPNEKPVDLMMKLIALFSERGETIFDPFAGSASIGEAALRLGRDYKGADNDAAWVKKAQKRLALGCFAPVADEHALGLCRMIDKKVLGKVAT